MPKKPGDTFGFQFCTYSAAGALLNADSLPTGMVVRNGIDDGIPSVAVTNVSTGLYKATGTLPVTYASGDDVQVRINASVGSAASGMLRDYGSLDTRRVGDLVNFDPTAAVPQRNQDAVTAPTYNDAFLGAWQEAYGKEPTFTTTTWVKTLPNNVGPARTFTIVVDGSGNVTSRS